MKTAYAAVNHGRWIVRCPACPSARLVMPGEAEFRCFSDIPRCDAYGVAFAIVWPSARALRAIETILAARPALENRNWEPHESVAELRAENVRHGIG